MPKEIFIVTFDCTEPGCERFEDVFNTEEAAEEYINDQPEQYQAFYNIEQQVVQ